MINHLHQNYKALRTTRNITNVGRSGNLKGSAPQQETYFILLILYNL
jgi:hypothetical protein